MKMFSFSDKQYLRKTLGAQRNISKAWSKIKTYDVLYRKQIWEKTTDLRLESSSLCIASCFQLTSSTNHCRNLH